MPLKIKRGDKVYVYDYVSLRIPRGTYEKLLEIKAKHPELKSIQQVIIYLLTKAGEI